jgi:diguanylate cyclase (GGDEF)-like protein
MPGIDGIDLARQIAGAPALATCAVVLLTDSLRTAAREDWPDNIIGSVIKPVRAQFLYDCLAKARHAIREHSRDDTVREQFPAYVQKRILIAEDNRASQQVAVAMLERLGCETEIAATGQEALERVRDGTFDLVLMDCHMPQMDGYEATRQIRTLGGSRSEVPIIAMTANTHSGDNEACIAAGMDDYLVKPVTLDLLRDKLGRWLARGKDRLEPIPAVRDTRNRYAVAESSKTALLDEKILGKLRDDTGDAFSEVLEMFLEDLPGYLRTLEKAILEQDGETMVEIAHAIKGSGRNLGAHRLVAVAKRLEDLGHTGAFSGQANALFSRLATEYELVKAELQQQVRLNREGYIPESRDLPRILVADDDRAMRFALVNVLQKDGYQIEQATNGGQAVSLCERRMPDLVLMDARMPRMDGFTACSRIRELPDGGNVPILIITALDDDHSIERAFSAGATDYIPKPVHFSVLRQRVARMLEASRAQQHVTRLAYQDPLTGLPNRTLFRERLEASLSRVDTGAREELHAVLFLDLDRFKLANDSMGHEIGDLLLKTAAVRIQECLRAGDTVSRFGGDEFTILLEDIESPEKAALFAERICKTIAKPFFFVGREFYLSASVGISMYPGDGTDAGTLIRHADMAMFRAKERGNTFRFFEGGMASAISKKLRLESDLRHALEHGEFLLHYQPQVDLATGQILGMEALLRWQHPDFGLVPPSQFIGLAEETGLIEDLGEWVLLTACAQNKAWQEAGLPKISVAINLSARQLEMDFETRVIRKVLAETGLEPQYLELELTESVVMKDPAKTRDMLRRLKEAGISISIDDFGTGYSSLNHLKNFSFDKLKIDQSFIRDVNSNPEDAGIVLTILAMARTLGLKVIAEGVETEEQRLYLLRNGCDEGQGFYFSKPLPPEDAIKLLRQLQPANAFKVLA